MAHATFCIAIVYNNVVARFRRMSPNLTEASADLGATGWQTFRHVVLPNLATALLAGGHPGLALSFDEIVVTTFTAGNQQTPDPDLRAPLPAEAAPGDERGSGILVIVMTFVPVRTHSS